jgi:hypothetical protein
MEVYAVEILSFIHEMFRILDSVFKESGNHKHTVWWWSSDVNSPATATLKDIIARRNF